MHQFLKNIFEIVKKLRNSTLHLLKRGQIVCKSDISEYTASRADRAASACFDLELDAIYDKAFATALIYAIQRRTLNQRIWRIVGAFL